MADIILCGGRPLTLIVLAGGESRRMKGEKALLPVPGGTLIERIIGQLAGYFTEVLISVSHPGPYAFLDHRLVVDQKSGQGPMMGIKSALDISQHEKNFVIACDIPDVDISFLKKVIDLAEDHDIVIPVSSAGRLEPLFAVYSQSVLPEIISLQKKGERSLLPLYDRCRTKYLAMGDVPWFKNLNTKEDLKEFLRRT